MKQRKAVVTWTIALVMLAVPGRAARAPEVAAVIKMESALNAGDVAGAVSLFDADATARDQWGKIHAGREQIQGWVKELTAGKFHADSGNRQLMEGGRVTWISSVADDLLRRLKTAPVDASGEALVKNGLISSFTLRFSAASMIKVTAALDAASRETVRTALEAVYNLKQAAAVTAYLDSGFIDHDPAPGRKGDRDGFMEGVKEMQAVFPDLHVTQDDLLVDGDKVTARLTVKGTGAGGQPLDTTEIQVFRIRDGRIIERWGSGNQSVILARTGTGTTAAGAITGVESNIPGYAAVMGGNLSYSNKGPAPKPMSADAARNAAQPRTAQPKEPPVAPLKATEPAPVKPVPAAVKPAPVKPAPVAAKPAGMETPPSQFAKKKGVYWY
jgi:predicted ester cyclase